MALRVHYHVDNECIYTEINEENLKEFVSYIYQIVVIAID